MKKILSILFLSSVYSLSSMAQTTEAVKPVLTKEQKEVMKRQKEEATIDALKKAGLSDEQVKRAQLIMQMTSTKNKSVKNDPTLSEEQKTTMLATNKEEQKKMLTDVMGADKYKAYSNIKKEQKAAAAATTETAE